MKSEEEIKHFYETRLYEKLLPLEEHRKKKVLIIKRRFWVTIISLILFIISILFGSPLLLIFFPIAVVAAGLTIQTTLKLNKDLRFNFKKHILFDLLEFLFEEFTYIPHQRIAAKVLRESQLLSDDILKVEGEDYMRFKLGETSIHFCETQVYGGGESSVFSGIFISSSFNKSFRSQTLVLPRTFRNKRRFLFSYLKSVELEDVDFKKEFIVLSTDQVESRYILTTAMMKRMLEYKHKLGKQISFSFTGNLLHGAIPNFVNLFEPALFDSFLDMGYLRKSLDALRLYTDIVEDLNLNTRIWSKCQTN